MSFYNYKNVIQPEHYITILYKSLVVTKININNKRQISFNLKKFYFI